MKRFAMLCLACVLATATSVAVAADEAAKPAAAADAKKPAADAKKIDWDKMDVNQKKKYMKSTVLPEMKKLFVAVDKKHYAKMNCQTCHGEKAADNKFKMPSAELPKLPQPTDQAGFVALQQKKPEVVKFMGTQVKPTMAKLLGKPEWEPNNPTGFGCYGCHTKMETAAAPIPPTPPATKPAAGAPATKPAAPAAGAPAPAGW
jgi:cytochrome c553